MGARVAATRVVGCIVILIAFTLPVARQIPPLFARDIASHHDVATVRIGVLSLFYPKEIRLSAAATGAAVLTADAQTMILEKSSGSDSVNVQISDAKIIVTAGRRTLQASRIVIVGRNSGPVDFTLSIPGRITRHYQGTLEIVPTESHLTVIVTMDREAAVASVVAAESDPDAPPEALKAQAVAARSYLASGSGRHLEFDFCDTTHCQFLREPPQPNSAAVRAAEGTRGLVLAYNSRPLRAMYTRSCPGQTHTPAQLGMTSTDYPYYPADCAYCRAHPQRWTSRITPSDAAALRAHDESSRLHLDRSLGWGKVPSNDFQATERDDEVVLHGTGFGHGIGLCQAGAKAMARDRANFREILSHYYPNTSLVEVADVSIQARSRPTPAK